MRTFLGKRGREGVPGRGNSIDKNTEAWNRMLSSQNSRYGVGGSQGEIAVSEPSYRLELEESIGCPALKFNFILRALEETPGGG